MKHFFAVIMILVAGNVKAQKVDSIFFNLYTDSLKKGVHNYINVDGKLSDKTFMPLTTNEVVLLSSAGRWDGNNLIIDSSYAQDSVAITAVLKDRPGVRKTIIVYLKKVEVDPQLATEKELLETWRREAQKKKRGK